MPQKMSKHFRVIDESMTLFSMEENAREMNAREQATRFRIAKTFLGKVELMVITLRFPPRPPAARAASLSGNRMNISHGRREPSGLSRPPALPRWP